MLTQIIIRVDNQRIYFNPTVSISWSQTNIPKEHFKFKKEFYWKVELIQYTEEDKYWEVKVVDYSVEDIETFSRQKPTKEIGGLNILPLDWELLRPLLFMHVKAKMGTHIIDQKHNYEPRPERRLPDNMMFLSEPVNRTIEITFSVSFKEANFSPGCVSFTKLIPEIYQDVDFQILNEHILKEFEDIKNWFAKKIGKSFTVNALIERIEETINTVTSLKRERYKVDYKNGLIDTDLRFYSIDHEKISTNVEKGFARWKHRLNSLLI